MSNQKTLNTRVQNKIDTSEHWALAENFIPLKGELIIYQDYDSEGNPLPPKYKSGDGKTKVNDLPFSTNIVDLSDYVHKDELKNYMTREEVKAAIEATLIGAQSWGNF